VGARACCSTWSRPDWSTAKVLLPGATVLARMILNGARGGTDIPSQHREGVYNHLAKHLRDAGEDPAELK
jgi:hypothetical protein